MANSDDFLWFLWNFAIANKSLTKLSYDANTMVQNIAIVRELFGFEQYSAVLIWYAPVRLFETVLCEALWFIWRVDAISIDAANPLP